VGGGLASFWVRKFRGEGTLQLAEAVCGFVDGGVIGWATIVVDRRESQICAKR
jgi:hypothetical protein